MHMARSTYYFEISRSDVVAERNQDVLEKIKSIFDENKRRYGVRRIHQELINRGYQVNHKRVQRLMHKAGLAGKRPKEKYHLLWSSLFVTLRPNFCHRGYVTP